MKRRYQGVPVLQLAIEGNTKPKVRIGIQLRINLLTWRLTDHERPTLGKGHFEIYEEEKTSSAYVWVSNGILSGRL